MGVGNLGWTRRFTCDRSALVGLRLTNSRGNNVPRKLISARTGEKELVFGTMIKEDAKQFIAAAIVMRAAQGR
jgi:hypothetical protein